MDAKTPRPEQWAVARYHIWDVGGMSVLPVDQAMASRVRGAPFGTGCWSGGHDHGHSLERDAHVDLDKLGHDHGHSLGRDAPQRRAAARRWSPRRRCSAPPGKAIDPPRSPHLQQ